MNVAQGISNLELLTTNEWAGVAFAIAIVVSADKGFIYSIMGISKKCKDRKN